MTVSLQRRKGINAHPVPDADGDRLGRVRRWFRRRVYRSPQGKPERYDLAGLWAMNVDGTALTLLRAQGTDGWALQGHAEWSPDGASIAMFGGATNPQIFIADGMGRAPRQVTNRPGVNTDMSWSPDGKTLLFNGCAAVPCSPAGYEIYSIPGAGSSAVRFTADSLPDYDPYFSPDGKTIAWLVTSDPAAWNGLGAWESLTPTRLQA